MISVAILNEKVFFSTYTFNKCILIILNISVNKVGQTKGVSNVFVLMFTSNIRLKNYRFILALRLFRFRNCCAGPFYFKVNLASKHESDISTASTQVWVFREPKINFESWALLTILVGDIVRVLLLLSKYFSAKFVSQKIDCENVSKIETLIN